jgi:hypothetical protein
MATLQHGSFILYPQLAISISSFAPLLRSVLLSFIPLAVSLVNVLLAGC